MFKKWSNPGLENHVRKLRVWLKIRVFLSLWPPVSHRSIIVIANRFPDWENLQYHTLNLPEQWQQNVPPPLGAGDAPQAPEAPVDTKTAQDHKHSTRTRTQQKLPTASRKPPPWSTKPAETGGGLLVGRLHSLKVSPGQTLITGGV